MIRFSRYIWLYALISLMVLVPGCYSLFRWGLQPSIDFTGGTVLEVILDKPQDEAFLQRLGEESGVDLIDISTVGQTDYTFRMKTTSEKAVDAFEKGLEEDGQTKVTVLRKDIVGPTIGKELLGKAVIAAILAILAILLYVAYAFKNMTYGVSAVVALAHDTLIMFTSFSLLGHFLGVEVDTLFVTAFLTTMSFSVHDTIVIFDRIREYRKKDRRSTLSDISDIALTETMGRSLVNSFTIMFMLLSLVLMGGESIRWFAVALLIGTTTGTYSSPFIATPMLLLLDRLEKKTKAH